MNTQTIKIDYNINRMEPVDLISTIHIDDKNTRYLELTLLDHGSLLVLQGCTVKARFVATDKALLSDNVPCTVTADNTILVPIDAAAVQSMACDLRIEVNIVSGTDVLTLPFPLWVRVRGSILDNAPVTPDTEGTVAELLRQAEEELSRVRGFVTNAEVYAILDEAFLGDDSVSPQLLVSAAVDAEHNPDGHLMLYYVDSEEVRHNIFDFTPYLGGTDDYSQLTNKPTINGITVEGAKVANSYQNIGDLKLLYYGRTQVFPYQHYELPMRSQSGLHSVYHDNSGYAFGDALVLNLLSYIDNFQRDDSSAVQGQICVQFKFLPCFDKSAPPKPLFRTKIVGSSDDSTAFSDWQELGITVQSAAVNNNGTITFTLSDGSAITTTGTSVIGPQGPAGANGQDGADGVSPTATVTQTATGATITVTDANGTTTANIANGQNYNLTAQDKSDIAALVLAQLPTTQGVQYGN